MTGLLVCGALVALLWWLLDDGREATLPDGRQQDVLAGREARLVELLDELADELANELGDGDIARLAAPAAADQLAAVDDNVRRIGFSFLALRYVAPAAPQGEQVTGGDTWVADVQLTWRFRRYDVQQATLEVPMVVVDDGVTARFGGIGAGDSGDRVPPWLLERLDVRKGARILVLAADARRVASLVRLARAAIPSVDEVLPGWRGALVLVEPSTSAVLNRAVGADDSTTAQLAGVTTTVDGAVVKGATSHVLLNPDVFDGLGPQAAQIVVTHEATHVATDGAVAAGPQWLVEGFADYVALRDLGLPVSVSASQVLADVRRDGPPAHLPSAADFGGQNTKLGAMYESAWLACRLLAETYGEDRLVRFYQRVEREGGVAEAFRAVLGTSEPAFTRSWRSYLVRLASAQ